MDQRKLETAERQLDRVLQFASRVENRVSVLLATDLGIVAVMLTNLNYDDINKWYIAIPLAVGLVMISQSLFHIYKATYPDLSGGSSSLIYFAEIARRTEAGFQLEFKAASLPDLYSDILGQIWRNSQITSQKFESVKRAFNWMVFSIAPWIAFLIASSVVHGRSILVK